MDEINLDDYYSCGYLLIRSGRPDWGAPFGELLPDGDLISLSQCICLERFLVTWGWIPGDRQAAIDFGIDESKIDEFMEWCSSEHHFEHVDVFAMFHSSKSARLIVDKFITDKAGLYIIGVALHQELLLDWLSVNEEEDVGVTKRLRQKLPVETGGTPLGFEVASFGYHDFSHSWLCSGVDKDMYELYKIYPGQYGLIQNEADARKVYKWMTEDGYWGQRGEPEPYYYFLLTSYPLD